MQESYKTNLIGVTSGRNFRELTGYESISGKKIKNNKLLRTGNLASLNSKDLTLLNNYGVKYDVDFRTKKEQDTQPDRVPSNALYEFDPVFSDDLTNSSKGLSDLEANAQKDPEFGFKHMLFAYEDMINGETAQIAYRKFFELLLTNDKDNNALLFHCTAGKDRTGWGAFLLLSALDIPLATIKYDYLLTNITTKDFINNMLETAAKDGSDARILQSIKDIQSVYPEYLDHGIKVLQSEYGNIDNYLSEVMKLSANDLKDLKSIYLA